MRRLIPIALVAILLTAASPPIEEGATIFDNGSCVEADGTAGLGMADGSCVTPADYDEMFSYENLSKVPSLGDPSRSIAETGDITVDSPPASVRPLGEGLIDPAEGTITFSDGIVIVI
jgi:hypothetical protein